VQKCRSTEVPAIIIALAKECAVGEQFNWAQFLCEEFLTNCREVQEEGNTFHYAWLLLSIVLVTTDLPEDSQFPSLDQDWPEVARIALLWATRDAERILGIKIFWILMEADIRHWVTRQPRLSTEIYDSVKHIVEFKADMHFVYIRVCKDPDKTWTTLPFLAIDSDLQMLQDFILQKPITFQI